MNRRKEKEDQIEKDKEILSSLIRTYERLDDAERIIQELFNEHGPYAFPTSPAWDKVRDFLDFDDSE